MSVPLSYLTDELKQEIKDVVCEIIEVEDAEVTESTLFREELNMDSLMAIEIVAAIEKRLQITIEEADVKRIVNLAGIFEIVEVRAAGN